MTRGFTSRPAVRAYREDLIETTEPLTWEDSYRGLRVTVPAFTVCDGASVPKWGWAWLSAGFVQLLGPGLLHDYLYRSGALIVDLGQLAAVFSRGWADTIMVEAMDSVGCSRRDQAKVKAALWIGGRRSWRRREVTWRGDS